MEEGTVGIMAHQEVVKPGEVGDGELSVVEEPGRHGGHLDLHLPPGQHPSLQLLTPVNT